VKNLRQVLRLPGKMPTPFRREEPAIARAYYSVLDVGTEVAKALVFVVDGGRCEILGVGKQRQGRLDMQDGLVTDIEAVVENCHYALQQAEDMAGVGGRDTIVGMAGELTKGVATTTTIKRAKPDERLSLAEIRMALEQAQRQAMSEVSAQIALETGIQDIEVRLVNSAVVSVRIDGHNVSNPLGFQGSMLTVTVFNAFAPLVHVGAMRTIVESLSLDLLAIVAEPYAVASAITNRPALDYGGVVIDVGGGTTDVALLRDGGIEGSSAFTLGGRAFTKRLAARRSISFDAAEDLKLRYAHDEVSPQEQQSVSAALSHDVQTWIDGVHLVLEEMVGDHQLPPYVYLCGGSSALPDLHEALRTFDWVRLLPMSRPAEITVLTPRDIDSIVDMTGVLEGPQDVTPLGLAYQVLALERDTGLMTEALHETVQQMGL